MKYNINLSPHARNDFSYMSLIKSQAKDINYIIDRIKLLSSSPKLGKRVSNESFFDFLELYFLKVGNYIIYYAIDELTHTIELYSIDIENDVWQKSLIFKTDEIIKQHFDLFNRFPKNV